MKRVVRATLAVAAAAAAAVGVAAVMVVPGHARHRRVMVAGDSITWLQTAKWHTLDDALDGVYDYTYVALPGKRIEHIQPALDRMLQGSRRSDAVVVNAGTNDMEQSWPDWEAAFDRMWRAVSQHPCVVYITVRELPDKPVGAAINRRIRILASRHPNVRIWDWNAYLNGPAGRDRAHPALFDPVHPAPDGARAISEGTRAALDRC
jgi:lysophospholipase L1-like esterase